MKKMKKMKKKFKIILTFDSIEKLKEFEESVSIDFEQGTESGIIKMEII